MDPDPQTRRSFLATLGATAGLAGLAAQGGVLLRSCVPNVTYDRPTTVKVGAPESFADGLTYLPEHRVFIVRESKVFRAVSAVCSHLGCTVHVEDQQLAAGGPGDARPHAQRRQFVCPCHGSRYGADGVNLSGPAPRPLMRCRLSLAADDGQLVVDTARDVGAGFTLTLP